ncbi:leucine-rich repeat domain-containing protein [Pseudomonas sp. Irchel 3A7]|uniref:leucine-rich repeat domain-containing protein n=1 Tax=Pseudomonas sp. Irchel 3A7 TaxID=2008913 RepID=UPI0021146C93|nr:leucine-rich repeat domain-containing protein [Pseudomonas sp. Irchel 3A7]
MRDDLSAAVDTALPQNPAQFGEQLIREKWGRDIDPQTAQLVTLHYDFWSSSSRVVRHEGQVARSQSLVQALLSNEQTVGDGRFGETAFGFYTPPDVGPAIHIMENIEPSDGHEVYEGIYRQTTPQTYGPQTQLPLRPADFKQWVWTLFFKEKYQAYVDKAWPSDKAIKGAGSYPLRTSTKAAFVMTAWLQRHENSLSAKGLELALHAAGLPPDQAWPTLTLQPLQAPTRMPPDVEASFLKLYRYSATDIWCFRDRSSDRVIVYIPGNSSPIHEFSDRSHLRQWIVDQGRSYVTRQALASHFIDEDRRDGTFHAGVLTALDGMAQFPAQHHLTREAGFFNNDGYWNPVDYIDLDVQPSPTDPFAQLVLTMKQAAQASVETIRDDAQVNRDNLSAVVEPIVQWVNQFGPLALFVPGGEGLLALAGLIDAGYGLDQAINGDTADKRSQGVTRTVFGVLNALPLVAEAASIGHGGAEEGPFAKAGERSRESSTPPEAGPVHGPDITATPALPLPTRTDLLRGVGVPAGTFSDEVLAQIGRVSAVDNDMLRLMQAGRAPTPLLADTIDRFRIDQEVTALHDPSSAQAEFNRRYQALQQSEHPWVQLFQRTYPDLPKAAVEQVLDRHGVDFQAPPDPVQAKDLFKQLDGKARQYQEHVRINRALEGLYLRSVSNPESDTLALHSLVNLPGWPKGLRLDVRDSSIGGRILDRAGPLDTPDCRTLIKSDAGYRFDGLSTQPAAAPNIYEAVVGVLTRDEHNVLGFTSSDPAAELKLNVSDQLLSRSELALGLSRMDSALPFEAQGLRGGGFPGTPQAQELTQVMTRAQLEYMYPEFSNAEMDAFLQQFGDGAAAHLFGLNHQLQQLNTDLNAWIEQTAQDLVEMDIPFLQMGEPEAAGLDQAQIQIRNTELLQEAYEYECETRRELADELIAVLQKRAPQQNSHYSGSHITGFTMNMDFEDFHRLPALSVRLNDVVELNLRNFHLTRRDTLDRFLEGFPLLRSLDLEGTDLRIPNLQGQWVGVLPSTIPELQHLTTLSLRSTHLRLSENAAGQLSQLVNLQSLDLGNNPLDAPPLIMGMNQLRTLRLDNAQITSCPVGIMDQPYLTTLDLSDNQIRRVPQAVLNQAVARDRVLLWHNPLTDEDTLRRLVAHRERTGLNLWLDAPGSDYLGPTPWLLGVEEGQRNARIQVWQRLALNPGSRRFLGAMSPLSLTADYRVNYLDLQARVWRLLSDADASQESWTRIARDVPMPGGAFDNPIAVLTALEDRARLYNDWVAMGRPFQIE